jgi:hypothetical protein
MSNLISMRRIEQQEMSRHANITTSAPFRRFYHLLSIACLLSCLSVCAQEKEVFQSADSLKTVTTITDSSKNGQKVKKTRVYNPRKAALYSAILPGLGQIYNRKYWKLPIVYGALGGSAAIFFFNLNNYKATRFAYRVKYNMRVNFTDSALAPKIRADLVRYSEESLRANRDAYRRDIDYSVLFLALLWGLNVVDAAVDAHLKAFDVSPDLSLWLKPGHSEMAGTNGISLVLRVGKTKSPTLLPNRF